MGKTNFANAVKNQYLNNYQFINLKLKYIYKVQKNVNNQYSSLENY